MAESNTPGKEPGWRDPNKSDYQLPPAKKFVLAESYKGKEPTSLASQISEPVPAPSGAVKSRNFRTIVEASVISVCCLVCGYFFASYWFGWDLVKRNDYITMSEVKSNYISTADLRAKYLPLAKVLTDYMSVPSVASNYISKEQMSQMIAQNNQTHLIASKKLSLEAEIGVGSVITLSAYGLTLKLIDSSEKYSKDTLILMVSSVKNEVSQPLTLRTSFVFKGDKTFNITVKDIKPDSAKIFVREN
jgi:hypothetical protein